MKSTIFVLFLLMATWFLATAPQEVAAAQAGDYTYTLAGSPAVATITGYTGTGGSISIPSTVDGYPAVAIGERAFELKTTLVSVSIPESVMSIGENAFSECTNLTSVTIPESMSSIGGWAFYECNALNSLTIPGNVTSIGGAAFAFCTALTFIDVDAGNLNYSSVDGVLYNQDRTTLLQFPAGKAGSFQIPDSVERIGTYAFCQSTLTSLTFGADLTSLGDYAFFRFSTLAAVDLSIGITEIGYGAFGFCTALTSVTVGSKVTSIGDYAFAECANLTAINIDAANENYCSVDGVVYDQMRSAILVCPGGKTGSFTIPAGVTRVGTGAFYADASLTQVVIPEGVSSIGGYAFAWCASLISVNIPNNVTDVGECAFIDCSSLTRIDIPSKVTSIGNLAFAYCSALTAIDVDPANQNFSSVDGVLYNQTRTTLIQCPGGKAGSFTMPESVIAIESYAFVLCEALNATTIGSRVANIGDHAFDGCANLTSITFLGSEAPATVGASWITGTPAEIRGHAYAASNFPAPGSLWNGLMMEALIPVAPGAPTNLTATSGNWNIGLTWQAPASDGGSPITLYYIYRALTQNGPYQYVGGALNLAYTDTGLINGQTYWYRVSAVNEVEEGDRSTPVSMVPGLPSAPSALTAAGNAMNITLSWQAPSSSGIAALVRYDIYRGASPDSIAATPMANVSAGLLSYSDLAVSANTTYYYLVRAVNSAGSSPASNLANATALPPTVPSAPQNVVATPGPARITISWQAPASTGGSALTYYKVFQDLAGGSMERAVVSASILSYQDNNVSAGSTYAYHVIAVNAIGDSAASAQVQATPQSAAADNTILFVGIAIAIIAVIVIAVVVMRRKK